MECSSGLQRDTDLPQSVFSSADTNRLRSAQHFVLKVYFMQVD